MKKEILALSILCLTPITGWAWSAGTNWQEVLKTDTFGQFPSFSSTRGGEPRYEAVESVHPIPDRSNIRDVLNKPQSNFIRIRYNHAKCAVLYRLVSEDHFGKLDRRGIKEVYGLCLEQGDHPGIEPGTVFSDTYRFEGEAEVRALIAWARNLPQGKILFMTEDASILNSENFSYVKDLQVQAQVVANTPQFTPLQKTLVLHTISARNPAQVSFSTFQNQGTNYEQLDVLYNQNYCRASFILNTPSQDPNQIVLASAECKRPTAVKSDLSTPQELNDVVLGLQQVAQRDPNSIQTQNLPEGKRDILLRIHP